MKVVSVFGGSKYERPEIEGGTAHFGAVAQDAYTPDLRYRTVYAVIHRGTGASIADVRSRKAAIALMARLEALPVDWAFRKKGSRKHLAVRRYLEGLPASEWRKLRAVAAAFSGLAGGR